MLSNIIQVVTILVAVMVGAHIYRAGFLDRPIVTIPKIPIPFINTGGNAKPTTETDEEKKEPGWGEKL